YWISDLNSRNKTKLNNVELQPGQVRPLQTGDRINICDVEFVYYKTFPPESNRNALPEVVVADDFEESTIHTLDASRSDAQASHVRPEAKLQAIIEISRNLSSELSIDTVGPKILDSLSELFPQSERLFLLLQDQATKRLIRKAFKHKPTKSLAR